MKSENKYTKTMFPTGKLVGEEYNLSCVVMVPVIFVIKTTFDCSDSAEPGPTCSKSKISMTDVFYKDSIHPTPSSQSV